MLTGNLFRNVFDLRPKTFPTSSGSGTTQVATTPGPQSDAGLTITPGPLSPDLPGAIPWWGFVLIGVAAAGGTYYYLDKKGTFR